jgi:hypothetical protein
MSIELVSFVFGGLLVFVGLVGGGFEVKELKVPKVGMGVRVVAMIVGVLFVGLGFATNSTNSDKPSMHEVVAPPPVYASQLSASQPEGPVEVMLIDDLGQGEISEQVTVLIDGKNVGNLTVNGDYPHSSLRINVSKPGQHSYTAEAAAVFNVNGYPMQYSGAGQGMIDIESGRTYSLRGSITGNTWLVSLEQEQ